MSKIISVVVCTHNREKYIGNCIRSLLAQTLDRDLFEIIIVDNASTDNTSAILKQFSHERSFRIIYEATPGLSVARNHGWQEAVGKYISYLDDDAIADEGWLEAVCWAFEHLSPIPKCLTGIIRLAPERTLPEWIAGDLRVCLGYLQFGDKPLEMHYTSHKIIGANCHFTRSILVQTGGFDEGLGRKKSLLLSGEEIQLQRVIESLGGAIWYHPDVAVTHCVSLERLTPGWFYRRYFWGGVSDIYMKNMHGDTESAHAERGEAIVPKEAGSQWKRLLSNFVSAFGLASGERVIQGRIYMSYVFGYIYGIIRHLVERRRVE